MKLLVGRTASLEPKWAGKKVNVHQDFDAEGTGNRHYTVAPYEV